jgi:hypothetical protein
MVTQKRIKHPTECYSAISNVSAIDVPERVSWILLIFLY